MALTRILGSFKDAILTNVVSSSAQIASDISGSNPYQSGSTSATGGSGSSYGTYKVHTYKSSGVFNVYGGSLTEVDVLVVGGGGGGGGARSGGGGAGGFQVTTGVTIHPGSYPMIVGRGGKSSKYNATLPRVGTDQVGNGIGLRGGDSHAGFLLHPARGGGCGDSYKANLTEGDFSQIDGASGGGAAGTETFAEDGGAETSRAGSGSDPYSVGYPGGRAWEQNFAGGGGGAGGAGGDAPSSSPYNDAVGGAGATNNFQTGTNKTYAGGGGGGGNFDNNDIYGGLGGSGGGGNGNSKSSSMGEPNTGGGGGGSGAQAINSGHGGSGVIILRYSASLVT